VSNVVDHRHALTPGSSVGNTPTITESRGESASDLHEPAMTEQGWRSRNPTESGVGAVPDGIKAMVAATPPRHFPRNPADLRPSDGGEHTKQVIDQSSNVWPPSANVIPRNPRDTSSATASPKYRVRQHQHLQALPHPASRDSQSVQSHASSAGVPLPPSSADWQWGKRIDPDDQEQALFEQRLCEDVYGVAVRKINQNGKSNLRYVKCYVEDIPEREGLAPSGSSSRSLSSRSRGALSRLRGDRDRSVDRSEPGDYDPRRNLIKKNKRKVLTWGKKKDVKLPLDRFVCVRKGKTNDRTRRNTSPSSRILSLITDDSQHPSLDIEAPTKVDREKFARAFARFLDVPLENEDNHSVRSAEVAPSSIRGKRIMYSFVLLVDRHAIGANLVSSFS
jgi:hypothetical protein